MTALLLFIIVILLILLISTKLGLTAYIAWMEENHFPHPSDKEFKRLIRWCVKNYMQDLFGKS
ncbi:hypothetical protein D7V94_01945 [Parablautia intestinalis]|uniref:Uncharacterized protein n=1 Tax=Parablautia intestinalis TaxID=2320100 RepID=A0A3A9ASZ2_9FIRM|nr:hypothetical protein D7V94_01945 [Parablautia intestinalis]